MGGLCAVKNAFLKSTFILSVFGLSVAWGPLAGWSNTLGLPYELGKFPFYPVIRGEVVSATGSGSLSIQWFSAAENKAEILDIQQRNVLAFDQEFIDQIAGQTVKCKLIFDFENMKFGECALLPEGGSAKDYIKIYKYLELFRPDLVGCSELEKRAYRSNNLDECPFLKKND